MLNLNRKVRTYERFVLKKSTYEKIAKTLTLIGFNSDPYDSVPFVVGWGGIQTI